MRRFVIAACTVTALYAPLAAVAATDDKAETITSLRPGTISTAATAHRRLRNTVADISVGIEVEARDVATVTRQIGERSQALMTYLRGRGAERLNTADISVEPQTHTVRGGPDVIVGYIGRVNVSFRTGTDAAGELITGSLTHGANTLQSAGFSPSEEDVVTARRELALEATKTAMQQARGVAEAAGERVLAVREIDVDHAGPYLPPISDQTTRFARMAAPAPAAKPVATEAGEQDVSVSVNVKTAIGPTG